MTISFTQRVLKPLAMMLAAGAGLACLSLRAQAEDMAQVLTRGPVHEAFAGAVNYEAKPGIIVPAKVPQLIEEMPPDEQPEGENITWIPGYWAWDDERSNFIWISGVWRNVPPGRQWVPGYWNDLGDGSSQWVSGYWASTEQKETTYVPSPPPENLDHGPNIEAPSSDHSWIPGYWYWADTRYVWRPGYWLPLGQHWTWVPPYYSWTPCGYAYVSGYWDYAIAARGVLYAPVCFNAPLYADVAYSYVPWVTVSLSVFSDHLFYRPYWCHYYFGDYYAPYYGGCGYYASFAWTSGCHGYDPIYCHNRWTHRGNPNWENGVYGDFQYFRNHENARPAHTLADMQNARTDQFRDGRNRQFASTRTGETRQDQGTRFRRIDETRRTELTSQSREIQRFSQERRQAETRNPDAKLNANGIARSGNLNSSPIRSRQTNGPTSRNVSPPRRSESTGNNIARTNPRPQQTVRPQAGPSSGTDRQRTQRAFDGMSQTHRSNTSSSAIPAPQRTQIAPARNRAPAQVPRSLNRGTSTARSLPRSYAAPSVRPQSSSNRSGARAYLPSRSSGTRVSPSYSGSSGRVGSTMSPGRSSGGQGSSASYSGRTSGSSDGKRGR